MTAKTMEDVLMEHQRQNERSCLCGWAELGKSHPEHQAAALTAAGFGLVADAKREALEEAAANILTNDPLDYWAGHLPEGLGWQEAMSRWLRARAAAVRGEG